MVQERVRQMERAPTEVLQLATLGGGCFWCLEPVFRELRGVHDVVVGYAGGETADPSYREVGTGLTGHAEVVQIAFDPQAISFREILDVFFHVHDPTTLNRQGADVGPQYRSVILYHDQAQKQTAEEVIRQLESEGTWRRPIVTEVAPYRAFYRAEEYHQRYFERNPTAGYCRVVIAPKVAKFREKYASMRRTEA
jgi:peptide-methionine (S)-S-oxide reductase